MTRQSRFRAFIQTRIRKYCRILLICRVYIKTTTNEWTNQTRPNQTRRNRGRGGEAAGFGGVGGAGGKGERNAVKNTVTSLHSDRGLLEIVG